VVTIVIVGLGQIATRAERFAGALGLLEEGHCVSETARPDLPD
jgi:hypothetical protein